MEKLIAACVANPTDRKALERLAKYDRKHPMARCLLAPSDQALVNLLIGA